MQHVIWEFKKKSLGDCASKSVLQAFINFVLNLNKVNQSRLMRLKSKNGGNSGFSRI